MDGISGDYIKHLSRNVVWIDVIFILIFRLNMILNSMNKKICNLSLKVLTTV